MLKLLVCIYKCLIALSVLLNNLRASIVVTRTYAATVKFHM